MQFRSPIPFLDALDKLRQRRVLPLDFDTFQWRMVPVAIRERAFFSSQVESTRLLQSMKDFLDDHLANSRMQNGGLAAHSRAQFVAEMREIAIREGLGKVDPATGAIIPFIRETDLTDIRSIARLELIFDTQTEAAQEHGYWKQGQDSDLLYVFPALRFIRIRPVQAPRSYHETAIGEIRRKDDLAYWTSLNRDFEVPWGPWGFNSGCGVEDVDREEAIQAGVIKESDTVRPVEQEFNAGLQASTRALDPGIAAALARATGGTVAGGTLKARASTPAPSDPWQAGFKNLAEAEVLWKDALGVQLIETQTPKSGPRWGAKFTSQKQLLDHLQRVGMEMARLVAAMPTLKGKLKTFIAVKSKRGLAHVDGPAPKMSTKVKEWPDISWEKIDSWEKLNGRRWGTERKGHQVQDNFRHELGHTLSTPKAIADFKALAVREGWNKAWIRNNVSEYAATKDEEAIAESFGLFTREDYQPGTLPAALETYLQSITL